MRLFREELLLWSIHEIDNLIKFPITKLVICVLMRRHIHLVYIYFLNLVLLRACQELSRWKQSGVHGEIYILVLKKKFPADQYGFKLTGIEK